MPTQIQNPQPELNLCDNYLDIYNLRLTHPEILSYFTNLDPEQYTSEAVKAFEIGISVISRLQQSQNLDFIEAKFNDIMCRTQEHFHNFNASMQTILENNLNPTKAGSFLSQAHTLISAQSDIVNAGLTQALRDTRESISDEAAKLQTGREQLDRKMDPNNNLGYLAAIIQKMDQFDRNLNQQFSETDTASFVGKLQSMVNQHFGEDGRVLELIQKQLAIDPASQITVQTPLNQVYHLLRQEIAGLRDTIMKIAGQQEMLEQTSKKGFPFEDKVFEELQRIARPFGEIVEDTSLKVEAISGSKKGDYVYRLTSSDASIVLDAKNYGKLNSLPAMLQYLKDAMHDRDSKVGIIVVPKKDNLQKQIGSWNVYGRSIITPLEYLEISIKFSKFMIQLHNSDAKNINIGLIQQKLETVQRKMKEITSVKSKLTKLSNGVAASVADIQENLDTIRQDVNEKLLEIHSEFKKE
jgi:hypothetical protein